MNITWTAPLKETASKLWKEGYNVRQIIEAMELPVSRNSVIGVATRNREMFPKKQPGFHGTRKPREQTDKPVYPPKLTFTFFSSIPKPPKPIEITRQDNEPQSLNISMVDIEQMACRWPTSGTGADIRFCGHKTTRSYFYCEHHKERRRGKA